MTDVAEAIITEELEAQLPNPVGYKVLIAMPHVEETFEGTDLLKQTPQKSRTGHVDHRTCGRYGRTSLF